MTLQGLRGVSETDCQGLSFGVTIVHCHECFCGEIFADLSCLAHLAHRHRAWLEVKTGGQLAGVGRSECLRHLLDNQSVPVVLTVLTSSLIPVDFHFVANLLPHDCDQDQVV